MEKIKNNFLFITLHKIIIKESSLRNNFWTNDKYSTIYWTSVLIWSLALSVFLSYDIILKWYNSPVNRFIVNEPRHISENPFPAITICHNDPFSSNTMNLASVLDWERQNKTDEEWQMLNVVYTMCVWKHKIYKLDKIDPEIVFKVLQEVSTKCEDIIKQIRWKDKIISNPCEIMQPTFLLYGLCFSFNALPYHDMYRQVPYKLQEVLQIGKKWSNLRSNWNSDSGYSNNSQIPWKMESAGYWNSIEFILAQTDPFYGCSAKQGFSVYFHNPSDVPDYSHTSVKLSQNTHSHVQITTSLSLTDANIKNWPPEKRGCYYSDEKWLKYNTIYSYINCYVECQVNYTEVLCGCSPIYRINSSFPVCGPNVEKCKASASVLSERAYLTCKCLPSCTDFDYALSYSVVPKNFSYIKNSIEFLHNSTVSFQFHSVHGLMPLCQYRHDIRYNIVRCNNLASIEVAVNSDHTWPFKRNAEDTNIGYIGQIGGITNLCRGLSLISIMDIVYLIFVNPFFH